MTLSFLVRQIDITRPLVHQGPFDVIVHKLSDVVVEAERDSQSQRVLADFQVAVAGFCRPTDTSLGGIRFNLKNPPLLRCRATCRLTPPRFFWTLCPP